MLTHFQSLVLFAFLVSVAFGCLSKRTAGERIRSALWIFALFILVGVAIGWVMYPFSR
jgi:NhaP-type Na+/H+ or K+/H+ antiporter